MKRLHRVLALCCLIAVGFMAQTASAAPQRGARSGDIIMNETGRDGGTPPGQTYLNPQFRYQGAGASDGSRLRTQRLTGIDVLNSYYSCRRLGLSEPTTRAIYEKAQNATMADVVATQQKWVKDRHYTYAILGDIKDLDTKFLSTLGPVQTVSLEEIFGY